MSLIIKKQFPEFEINQYTEEKELTLDEVLLEIREFDWVNESLKGSKIIEEHAEPSIWLKNRLGHILAMSWADDNKFAVYYNPRKPFLRSNTSIINGITQVNEVIKLFSNNEKDLLLNRLRASDFHQKTPLLLDFFGIFISKGETRTSREVINEEFIYEVKNMTLVKSYFFSFIFLIMTPLIWAYSSIINNRPFNPIIFLALQSFFSLFALPGLIITLNHLKKNKHWKVYFKKGENIFFIVTPSDKLTMDKSDYVKRILTTNNSNAPWNNYEYTTLIKNNGEQLHFSNLLIPSSDIEKLFGRIDEDRDKSGFQIIKDKKLKR